MNNSDFNNFTNQNFSNLSNWLNSLDPYEFALVGVIAAFLIAPTLTTNQQNSVGNFLEEVGQVLLTIGAQNVTVNQAKQNKTTNNSNSQNDEIRELKQEIENLKNIINNKL